MRRIQSIGRSFKHLDDIKKSHQIRIYHHAQRKALAVIVILLISGSNQRTSVISSSFSVSRISAHVIRPSYISDVTNNQLIGVLQRHKTYSRWKSHSMSKDGSVQRGDNQRMNSANYRMSAQNSFESSNTLISKYNLVWSPQFWKRMILSWALWWILQQIYFREFLFTKSSSMPCHHGWGGPIQLLSSATPTAVVLPLLSSSCCAIQIVINLITGWGCAGFNTYLGPIRPILLPLMLLSTWQLRQQRSLWWTILSLFLGFLPEMVDVWNAHLARTMGETTWKHGSSAVTILTSLPVQATLRLHVPTMGCVACVNKIDSSIRKCAAFSSIQQERSWLKEDTGGLAELSIAAADKEGVTKVVEEVVTAVRKAGFECTVENITWNTT